jgi:XK-related protein
MKNKDASPSDAGLLQLVEGFLESAPQCAIQLYIVGVTPAKEKGHRNIYISFLIKFLLTYSCYVLVNEIIVSLGFQLLAWHGL